MSRQQNTIILIMMKAPASWLATSENDDFCFWQKIYEHTCNILGQNVTSIHAEIDPPKCLILAPSRDFWFSREVYVCVCCLGVGMGVGERVGHERYEYHRFISFLLFSSRFAFSMPRAEEKEGTDSRMGWGNSPPICPRQIPLVVRTQHVYICLAAALNYVDWHEDFFRLVIDHSPRSHTEKAK